MQTHVSWNEPDMKTLWSRFCGIFLIEKFGDFQKFDNVWIKPFLLL